jgi:hypothetical protein
LEPLLHEFGLVLLTMLLLSERSWKHHYVTALPSAWILAAVVAERRPRGRIVLGLLLAAAALVNVPSADLFEPIFGARTADRVLAFGPYAWAASLMAAAHAISLAEYNSCVHRRSSHDDRLRIAEGKQT